MKASLRTQQTRASEVRVHAPDAGTDEKQPVMNDYRCVNDIRTSRHVWELWCIGMNVFICDVCIIGLNDADDMNACSIGTSRPLGIAIFVVALARPFRGRCPSLSFATIIGSTALIELRFWVDLMPRILDARVHESTGVPNVLTVSSFLQELADDLVCLL